MYPSFSVRLLNQLKEEQNYHYVLSWHGTLSTMVRAAVFETVDIGSIPVECLSYCLNRTPNIVQKGN
jgi:hypothetical protein